jgi:hypothetical protein
MPCKFRRSDRNRPVEAMERLLFFLKKFSNNPQLLLEIKG